MARKRRSVAGTAATTPTRKARPFVPKREQGGTAASAGTAKTKPTKPKNR